MAFPPLQSTQQLKHQHLTQKRVGVPTLYKDTILSKAIVNLLANPAIVKQGFGIFSDLHKRYR
ncbi:MAG: hypothetical protein A2283_18170 [Lentisphaerae bacterium RIFOXYA12_FULL_48_11]|nr:MAG: hypothetical protein A2283_18170 [Lentisphaerae bacterium RIFOXYA12_FULL_48_11]